MEHKKILLVKPGAISEDDKKRLGEQGFVVIQTKSPQDVKVLSDFGVDDNMVLSAALEAMSCGNDDAIRLAFSRLFRKKMEEKLKLSEEKKKPAQ